MFPGPPAAVSRRSHITCSVAMASAVEKPEIADVKEEDDNPEELMDEEDENDDGEDGDDGDLEEDVVVEVGATYSCKRQDGTFLNNGQNEWVDKPRLVIPKPVKEANDTDPKATEDGRAPLKRKNNDGTPEAKRVKTNGNASSPNSVMASGNFSEELTCLLCSELFKDPVMVECGHNFCRNCIDKAWGDQESFTCPDCEEDLTEKRYTTNRALANLVKKTVDATTALTPAKPAKKPKLSENCPEHDERLKLYCKDDGMLCCVICRDSLKHENHNYLPILDAVGVYRTELSTIVAPLEATLKVTEELTSQQSKKVEQQKSNASESRQYVVSEFEKLYTFLKERKEKLLEQLQEQGENLLKEMETNIVKLQENLDNIKEAITMANERMNDDYSISFLTGIKPIIDKCQGQQKEATVAESSFLSKDLCQGTFKGPIQYTICKQMKSIIVPPEKTIWIVGNSDIYWARERASKNPYGLQLGLPKNKCKVFWFGQKDLMWSGLKELMAKAEGKSPAPDILVIHAGVDDLPYFFNSFIIINDIKKWRAKWPGVKVVWSNIILRKYSKSKRSPLLKARKRINGDVASFLVDKDSLLDHDEFSFQHYALYTPDGQQLSSIGLDQFIVSLQQKLMDCLEVESLEAPTSSNKPGTSPLPSLSEEPANELEVDLSETTENPHAKKTVWIVGHSYVFWAEQRASRHPYGTQLGFPRDKCKVFWFGQNDLKWSEMKQLMTRAAEQAPAPDILVIHAGGNDLVKRKSKNLIEDIFKDFKTWFAKWPGVMVVWSRIIKRKHWRDATDIKLVENERKKVNKKVRRHLMSKEGSVLDHDEFSNSCSNLFKDDGEELSDFGLDLFNNSLRNMLKKCLQVHSIQTATSSSKPGTSPLPSSVDSIQTATSSSKPGTSPLPSSVESIQTATSSSKPGTSPLPSSVESIQTATSSSKPGTSPLPSLPVELASEQEMDLSEISTTTPKKDYVDSIQTATSSSKPGTSPLPSLPVELASEQERDLSEISTMTPKKDYDGKTIWIVGHSFVYCAKVRAASRPHGVQLGFPENKCKIFWFGEKDLLWKGMNKLLERAADQAPAPDILVIHAGENDLPKCNVKHFIKLLIEDIKSWMVLWPGVKVVWSSIIHRRYSQHVNRTFFVENVRKKVNAAVSKFLLANEGSVLDHANISPNSSDMYTPNRQQLSYVGIDCFNRSLQEILEVCLHGMNSNSADT